jgi:hypothetical protein
MCGSAARLLSISSLQNVEKVLRARSLMSVLWLWETVCTISLLYAPSPIFYKEN